MQIINDLRLVLQYNNIIWNTKRIINLFDDTKNQPSQYRKRYWTEINNELLAAFSANSDIKFYKTSMVRSNVCDY